MLILISAHYNPILIAKSGCDDILAFTNFPGADPRPLSVYLIPSKNVGTYVRVLDCSVDDWYQSRALYGV